MSDWTKDLCTSWSKRYGAVIVRVFILFFFLVCSLSALVGVGMLGITPTQAYHIDPRLLCE